MNSLSKMFTVICAFLFLIFLFPASKSESFGFNMVTFVEITRAVELIRTITIVTPTSSQTFTTSDSVVASGQATVSGGDENFEHYGVKVTWQDTPNVTTPCIPVNSSFGWTTDSSNNHIFSSTGTKAITARLYHQCLQGSEPSQAEASAEININIVVTTCDLTASPNPAFGSLSPGATSGDEIKTTLTNAGNVDITSLLIKGSVWNKVGNGVTFPIGQTKYALTDSQDYDSGMTGLTGSDVSLGITPFVPSDTQDVFFKVRIPSDQAAGDYEQTITFTFEC